MKAALYKANTPFLIQSQLCKISKFQCKKVNQETLLCANPSLYGRGQTAPSNKYHRASFCWVLPACTQDHHFQLQGKGSLAIQGTMNVTEVTQWNRDEKIHTSVWGRTTKDTKWNYFQTISVFSAFLSAAYQVTSTTHHQGAKLLVARPLLIP